MHQIGGFLHLSIGEEATIVGSTRALRAEDYLVSTYRSHGDALARGTPPERGWLDVDWPGAPHGDPAALCDRLRAHFSRP